jgi:hypothetical protein
VPDWINTEYLVADLFRVFALSITGWNIAATFLVISRYYAAYQRVKRATPKGERPLWPGLLPHHVYVIATSYLLLTLATVVEVAERVREEPTWWLWVCGAAYLLGSLGLREVFLRGRSRRGRMRSG